MILSKHSFIYFIIIFNEVEKLVYSFLCNGFLIVKILYLFSELINGHSFDFCSIAKG